MYGTTCTYIVEVYICTKIVEVLVLLKFHFEQIDCIICTPNVLVDK